MIRQVLFGGWSGNSAGGLKGWIIFGLHYRALLPRLFVAVAFFGLFAGLNSLFACFGFPWFGWSCARSFALVVITGYASLLSLRFVVGIAEIEDFRRAVAAIWLPIAVMALAAYLLFANTQGQELGLGLMEETDVSWVQTAALCLVLIYWALSAWLSVRIGLSRTFPQPKRPQVHLFWGPRLVGVLAHFIAAWSLSSAALKVSGFVSTLQNVLLALAAPTAIVLAILLVWFLDRWVISLRVTAGQRARACRKTWVIVGLGGVLIICLRWWQNVLPSGLLPGILKISLSVIVFLILISWIRRSAPLGHGANSSRRRRDARAEARTSWISALFLAAIMFAGTVWIWISPVGVGYLFGSLIIAFFAFGSFLVGANLLDLVAEALARDCNRRGFTTVHRRAVWCAFLGLLVAPAILMSFRNYHPVRLCDEKCKSAPMAAEPEFTALQKYDDRPNVTAAALAWYEQAERAYHACHPGQPVPLFIIATAGGGIRAAYWTASVLETLDKVLGAETVKCQNALARNIRDDDGLMRHLLFAISGVSGGSVGSAAYIAALHNHAVNQSPVEPTKYLEADLLAPGLASLAFIDIPSNFLPDFGQIDRGEALERGLEQASKDLMAQSFVRFFPKVGSSKKWRPALLLNATHQETGRRIITSNLRIEKDTFIDSYDALELLQSDVRLSTAAHNSARFTYVSPAGNLIPAVTDANSIDGKQVSSYGYVIDGGYFDNFGAQTAFELANKAIEVIGETFGRDKIRPVILQISSDPEMVMLKTLVRQRCVSKGGVGGFLEPPKGSWVPSLVNELRAPLMGIMSVRGAHGFAAVTSLAHLCCEDSLEAPNLTSLVNGKTTSAQTKRVFVHLAMCTPETSEKEPRINPPLGWVLSKSTRDKIKSREDKPDNGILGKCGNGDELAKLKEALGVRTNPAPLKEAYSNPKPDRS
ncbi:MULTISPECIES: hypothetical protein [unclassified Bradyrhizobium]|uniref:hypothetical protein n=1 Tax=unclassified Bradyrhizobium TaxID=2631580 RepID=UPI003398E11F